MNNMLRFTKVIFNNQWNLSEEKIGTNFWNTLYFLHAEGVQLEWADNLNFSVLPAQTSDTQTCQTVDSLRQS